MRTDTLLCIALAVLPFAASCGGDDTTQDMAQPDLSGGPPDDLSTGPITMPPGCTADTCFDFYGYSIRYRRMGNPSAPEKVMFSNPAVADDLNVWRFIQPALAQKYDTVSFDFLGYASSPYVNARVSMATQAEIMIALMDHLGWQKAHLTSLSSGNMPLFIMGTTPQYKPRVASIVFNDPAALTKVTPAGGFPVDLDAYFYQAIPGAGQVEFADIFWHATDQKERVTQQFVQEIARQHMHYLRDRGYDVVLHESFAYGIGALTQFDLPKFAGTPVGFVESDHDETRAPMGTQPAGPTTDNTWLTTNGGAYLTILPPHPHCGHFALAECPQDVTATLIKWIDAHPSAGPVDGGTD